MSDLIGQSLGRYHILEQLGEGGMATVYKAFDTRLEADVAVKVIRTENILPSILERTLKRFEREAKSLARLTHPNIVKVTDYGEFESKPYLVMEYLPGGTLKERIKQGPIPWQEAVQLLLPVAQALEYAHKQNLIHRDVKPANILLTESGQPMLSDFGVAKLFDMDSTADLTGTGMGVGTPEYMAPEQWQGQVSVQTDVYALGVVFYEMVTGRKPYVANTPAALLLKQANDPLPRPKSFVSNLPDAVEKVLFKALARETKERYQDMFTLAKAMEGLIARKPIAEARPPERVVRETTTAQNLKQEIPTLVDAKIFPRVKKPRPLAWLVGIAGIALIAILVGVLKGVTAIPLPTTMPTTTFMPNATNTPQATSTPSATPTITATVTPFYKVGSTWSRPADGMIMMYIPAGEFLMGSTDGDSDVQPVHTVYLDAFWMDQTEITNRMYVMCMDAGGCEDPGGSRRSSAEGYPNHPVNNGSWEMANTYCQWADSRLPTEAEWEKAARGGLVGKKYPWGDDYPTCQKGAKNGAQTYFCPSETVEVKFFAPNGFGLYDMAGNVWEWVMDWYDSTYYSNSPVSNPQGPSSGTSRVMRGGGWFGGVRGGAWYLNYSIVRSAIRNWDLPAYTYVNIGFRCARSLP